MTDAEMDAGGGGLTDADMDKPLRKPETPAAKPSLYDRFVEGVHGIGNALSAAGGAAGDILATQGRDIAKFAASPGQYFSDILEHPAERLAPGLFGTPEEKARTEQFARGVDKMVTFGLASKAGDALRRKVYGETPEQQQAAQEESRSLAPGFSELGGISGTFGPGAANLIGKGAQAVTKLLPVGKGLLAGSASGVAKGVAGYELAAPAISAGQAAVEGENPIQAARQAATDPAALALAGAGGALGGAGQGYAKKLRDTATLEGRTIADVEAAGGRIKAFGKPTEGGLYETPELADLKKGRAGVNEAAAQSVDRTLARNSEKYQAAQEQWGQTADGILSRHQGAKVPTPVTHSALDAIDAENTVNGVVGDPKLAAATAKARAMLTTTTDQLDRAAIQKTGEVAFIKRPEVAVDDLIKARKVLNRMARHTTEPAERYAFGKVLDALKEDAAALDPEIGRLNADYARTMGNLSASNDALFGKAKPNPTVNETLKASGAGRLGRAGDETQAGTLAEPRLQRFAEASPENAAEVRLMRAKKAEERLRYGQPEVSMPIEKGMGHAGRHVLKHAAGAVGLEVGGVPGAIAGYAAGALAENPLAARVRLGLPAAEAVGRLGKTPGANAMRLYIAREQQRRERANALGSY